MAASFPEEAGGRRWVNIVAINGAADMHKERDSEDEDAVDHRPLLNLLAATLHTDVTKSRDNICGLFGIIKSLTGSALLIPVNYRIPVRGLYRDVTRFLIKEEGALGPSRVSTRDLLSGADSLNTSTTLHFLVCPDLSAT